VVHHGLFQARLGPGLKPAGCNAVLYCTVYTLCYTLRCSEGETLVRLGGQGVQVQGPVHGAQELCALQPRHSCCGQRRSFLPLFNHGVGGPGGGVCEHA